MFINVPIQVIKKCAHAKQLHNFYQTFLNVTATTAQLVNLTNRSYSRYSASRIMPDSNTFSFNDYDIIGFDLDNTLMRYNLQEMIPLEYCNITNFLVKHHGYPKELLKPLSSDADFIQKGLILDVEKGNILKLDPKGYILKASHGSVFLREDEILKEYGPERSWDVTTKFINDPLSTWNGPLSEKMRTLLDYFDMPASLAFAHAVDIIDSKNKGRLKKYDVYSDILTAMIEMFKRESFAECTSEYFEALKADPTRYIMKTNPAVIEWLKHLKKVKTTYLLTGSHIDFANLTASTALGPDWKELFDVVVCFARKPAFFIEKRPFYQVEQLKETTQVSGSDLKLDNIYSQGNWVELEQLLRKKCKTSKPRSLYVGDNLIQDIHTPFKHVNMETVCVAEEILTEIEAENYEFPNIIKSKCWGSYFVVGHKKTFWTGIIENCAKICFPTVDYFACKPPQYKYCTNSNFYPLEPESLRVIK